MSSKEKESNKLVRYKDVCVALITMIAGAIEKMGTELAIDTALKGQKRKKGSNHDEH